MDTVTKENTYFTRLFLIMSTSYNKYKLALYL